MALPNWNELSPLVKRSPRKRWAMIRAELISVSGETFDIQVSTTDGTNALGSVNVVLTKEGKTYKAKTGSKGGAVVNNVPAGTYTVNCTKTGYTYTESSLTVTESTIIELALTAIPEPGPENGESS